MCAPNGSVAGPLFQHGHYGEEQKRKKRSKLEDLSPRNSFLRRNKRVQREILGLVTSELVDWFTILGL